MASQEQQALQYTIDELAAQTRVPSRTIRFYQSKGLLPPPEIHGRVAYYDDRHVERLALIAQLQDRGLSIKAIRDLVRELDRGRLDLNAWLGLERKLQAPWSDDQPQLLSEQEIEARFGLRPGMIAELTKLGLIEKRSGSYLISSPALLRIALELESAGIDLELAEGSARILRKHLGRAATDLAEYFFKRAGRGFGRRPTAEDLNAAYTALKPMGLQAIQLIFGQEMERVLRRLLGEGKAASLIERQTKQR